MADLECALVAPPLSTSVVQKANPRPEALADSQDSSAAQAAVDHRPDETPISDSPKPVQGLSRRHALAGLACLSAVLPAAAVAAGPDPVYAAIERYRQLSVEYTAAVDRSAALEAEDPDYVECDETTSRVTDALFEEMDVIFTFRPSTVAGTVALLKYISELEDWQMPAGLEDTDGKKAVQTLCISLAAALEQIGSAA
jgi:hypothetical protein